MKRESPKETARRRELADKHEYRSRWAFPTKARVTHPAYGEAIVPAPSLYGAILCAAEVWGCDWSVVLDAEVRSLR